MGMNPEEKFDLISRVESLYWGLFVPFTEAVDYCYGEKEKKEDTDLDVVRNLFVRRDEEIIETPTFRGYINQEEKRAITMILTSYAENGRERIKQIYQNAGVDLETDPWLVNELWLASLSLAEEIQNNGAGNLDSLRKIRWGIKLGLEIIPEEKHCQAIYKVIEELEGKDGERIRKSIDFFNQRQ